MPNFTSVDAARTWCEERFPEVLPSVSHIHWWDIAFWGAIIIGATYALVRFVPVLWTDIKGLFSSAEAGIKAGVTKVEAAV